MDREEARALLTIAGGEALDVETIKDFQRPSSGVTLVRYERVYAALIFAGLAGLPGFRLARKRRSPSSTPENN
jgi:hypothetical protein